jgi:hypothetical protein
MQTYLAAALLDQLPTFVFFALESPYPLGAQVAKARGGVRSSIETLGASGGNRVELLF